MSLLKSLNRWVNEWRTVDQLNSLSPRQLRDIGIEYDVNGYVRQLHKQ